MNTWSECPDRSPVSRLGIRLAVVLMVMACSKPDATRTPAAAGTDTIAARPVPDTTHAATPPPSTPVSAPAPAAQASRPPSAPVPPKTAAAAPPKPVATALPVDSSPTPTTVPDPAHDPYHPAPKDTVSAETYLGWKQFELNCSRCHGEFGVGSSFAPALVVSLKDNGTIPTKDMFILTVCQGRQDKGMPSWCAAGLEMEKIQAIYSYLKGRADGKIGLGRPAVREGN